MSTSSSLFIFLFSFNLPRSFCLVCWCIIISGTHLMFTPEWSDIYVVVESELKLPRCQIDDTFSKCSGGFCSTWHWGSGLSVSGITHTHIQRHTHTALLNTAICFQHYSGIKLIYMISVAMFVLWKHVNNAPQIHKQK